MASELREAIENAPLPNNEHLFCKGTLMPFNCTNSGVRKLMFSTNLEQRLALVDPDVPYVGTGFEPQFGKYSSSFEIADENYTVIAKIAKFSKNPNHHYYLLLLNEAGDKLDLIERYDYQHLTETFGYIYDNTALDILNEGDDIPKGTVTHKSTAFDQYNNRMDGKNLLAMFNASENTMEDSLIISESASKKLASPLVHEVNIILNTNDIPLNLFGTNDIYKIIPDIGENTKDDILCAIRREKKEEAFFSQDFNRLSQIFMSDDKITVVGKVVDIDVKCNNPEVFNDIYYSQIAYYYDDHIRMCKEIVDKVNRYWDPNNPRSPKLSYNLQKLYYDSLDELNGGKFMNEKVYSGTILKVTVVEIIPAGPGDKLTNRYGGKGVISKVIPDALMPKTFDGETIDIQCNMCGVYGRENAGQLFEMTINYRARAIVNSLCDEFSNAKSLSQDVIDFYKIVAPKQAVAIEEYVENSSDDNLFQFISSIIDDGMLYTSPDPGSDTPSIDTVIKLIERFPWIQQEYLLMPLVDSANEIKYVESRRPLIYGYIYYYRLKQHSEEKFSVTSLSATNIKNENSRNKASKVYKAQFSRTPIRFGDMELGDMSHMGIELVVQILMLYSSSPEARMLCEKAMTDDPYNVDITLGEDSSNIGAEIFATYMKSIGLALRFYKIPKQKAMPILKHPLTFIYDDQSEKYRDPLVHYAENESITEEVKQRAIKRLQDSAKYRYPIVRYPIDFDEPPEVTAELMKEYEEKYFTPGEEE